MIYTFRLSCEIYIRIYIDAFFFAAVFFFDEYWTKLSKPNIDSDLGLSFGVEPFGQQVIEASSVRSPLSVTGQVLKRVW